MRLEVKDKKGVLSNVTKTFSINKVSIKRLIQNHTKKKKFFNLNYNSKPKTLI